MFRTEYKRPTLVHQTVRNGGITHYSSVSELLDTNEAELTRVGALKILVARFAPPGWGCVSLACQRIAIPKP
jgi:hypothetical protein